MFGFYDLGYPGFVRGKDPAKMAVGRGVLGGLGPRSPAIIPVRPCLGIGKILLGQALLWEGGAMRPASGFTVRVCWLRFEG